jgi:hypothetical protein
VGWGGGGGGGVDQAISKATPYGLHARSNDYIDVHPGNTSLHSGSAIGHRLT